MPQADVIFQRIKSFFSANSKSASVVALIVVAVYALYKPKASQRPQASSSSKSKKALVDLNFLKRLNKLIRIVVPSITSRETFCLLSLSFLLILRTFMSLSISEIKGKIVKSIVTKKGSNFVLAVLTLGMYALPSSMLNSGLDYVTKTLALMFRENLSKDMNKKYLTGLVFYQLTGIDSRISNPDQRLTQDVDKWAESLSNVYSNLVKPALDIFMFSRKLSQNLGVKGPILIIAWYAFCGAVIKTVSPAFGTLVAEQQRKEGEFRSEHSDILSHSEEIAFYDGSQWQKSKVNSRLNALISHFNSIILKKLYMGGIDNFLVKYGAVILSNIVLALPVFDTSSSVYKKKLNDNAGNITKDYIKNLSNLVNLAKAIGKIMVIYKDFQSLAGYTSLISETYTVLEDLQNGKYQRESIKPLPIPQGQYIVGEKIQFENVPIISPIGDVLISNLNLEICQGMHTVIRGPNGCGKSSLFRILGELWPLFNGTVTKPHASNISYIPQRPYLPYGTFRDQIIYPDLISTKSDSELRELLSTVSLENFPEERGGFDKVEDWKDTLSGGEKQKLALCRILYHKPMFAILDECTSSVSMKIEKSAYEKFVELGITLITVTHRESLMQYHSYILVMDGQGGWEFKKLEINRD